jgi:hypothetical protein
MSEAAKVLSVGPTKMYSLVKAGELDCRQQGNKNYITRGSLLAYIDSLPSITHRAAMHGAVRQRDPQKPRVSTRGWQDEPKPEQPVPVPEAEPVSETPRLRRAVIAPTNPKLRPERLPLGTVLGNGGAGGSRTPTPETLDRTLVMPVQKSAWVQYACAGNSPCTTIEGICNE